LAKVLPVQGAMINASSNFFGPIGSASAIVRITDRLQIRSAKVTNASPFPKRLSVVQDAADKIGKTLCDCVSNSITGNTLLKVQNEPHMANPIFILISP
jgi:hypothetical protein